MNDESFNLAMERLKSKILSFPEVEHDFAVTILNAIARHVKKIDDLIEIGMLLK